MSDLRDELDREARKVRADTADLSRIRRRAERLRNRRRVTTAIVALAVGGAGLAVSYAAFRPGDDRRAASPAALNEPVLFPAPHDLPALQRSADAGEAPTWLDPEQVAYRYATDVMDWPDQAIRTRIVGEDPIRVAIWNPVVTPFFTPHVRTILTMERYEHRENGIYVVKTAISPAIEIVTPRPYDTVRPGETVTVRGRLSLEHEGGGFQALIGTAPGGTPSTKSRRLKPEFTFSLQAPQERAVAAAFTVYEAEGTSVATTAFPLNTATFDTPTPGEPSAGPVNEGAEPQYEFGQISVRPADNERIAAVFFTFTFEEYPGVHECTWKTLNSDGKAVGERTLMFAELEPSTDLHGGRPSNAVEMRVEGEPVSGDISCDPERLDTAGIAEVEPYAAPAESPEEAARIIEQRVLDWAERFDVDQMDERTKAANVRATELAANLLAEGLKSRSAQWLAVEELMTRATFLETGRINPVHVERF
jgi:hypothetical protein